LAEYGAVASVGPGIRDQYLFTVLYTFKLEFSIPGISPSLVDAMNTPAGTVDPKLMKTGA
jgi:hypothetical protein